MPQLKQDPNTFVEMVLILLEDRFPWLGTKEAVSGADTIDQLNELYATLRKARMVGGRAQRPTHY